MFLSRSNVHVPGSGGGGGGAGYEVGDGEVVGYSLWLLTESSLSGAVQPTSAMHDANTTIHRGRMPYGNTHATGAIDAVDATRRSPSDVCRASASSSSCPAPFPCP